MFRPTLPLFSQKAKSKSASWASRQLRDPYVRKRQSDPASYRARSAFKLLEINDLAGGFLDHGDVRAVVDLGAAPGGWSQVVAQRLGWGERRVPRSVLLGERKGAASSDDSGVDDAGEFELAYPAKKSKRKSSKVKVKEEEELTHYDPLNIDTPLALSTTKGRGTVLAVDLLPIEPIHGVRTIQGDFLLPSTSRLLTSLLQNSNISSTSNSEGKVDVILSDMAANLSGNDTHDIQNSLEICESVFEFARGHLRSAESIGRKRGGVVLMKFFTHPLLESFKLTTLKPNFNHVMYVKPDASRASSREGYFLCMGWNQR